jgi:3-dehydroquinate synthase
MKSKLTYLKKLELFKELDNYRDGQFYAVIDQKIKNHLPQWIQFSPHVFWLKNPEEEKNLEHYGEAIEFFLRQGIQRSSHLYAFGGGATSDFAGFVAATILRGIKWSVIPTTLLAMVDGAIGGKVAINMPQGKNLLGSFHLPQQIFFCGEFLSTLPEKEIISGKGEVLKYGFLSKDIYQLIMNKSHIDEISVACAKFKNFVVENDLRDQGERVYLNLGHTLGHAFESTLKIPHGQAVAMGLKYIFRIMRNEKASLEWDKMAKALGLPTEKLEIDAFPAFSLKTFLSYLEQDKKKIEASLRLVLVRDIGSCYLEDIPLKEFKTKIECYEEFRPQEKAV